MMILQGVGHPMSCLCYANDPQKGGYTTYVPALDPTASLQGDSTACKQTAPPNSTVKKFTEPTAESD
jgi:hypothetical protein